MVSRIYLDHHTATKPSPSAVEKMLPFYKERWGSVASAHQMGQELFFPMQESLKTIVEELGGKEGDHFFLMSSGAEAMAAVYHCVYLEEMRKTGKNQILCLDVGSGVKRLEPLGCFSRELPVNAKGQVTRSLLEGAIRPRTALISLPWANGLTGVIHPVEDLAAVCKDRGVLLHVDASEVIGKLYFRFQDLGVDFLTFDGQVIHAPKGNSGLLSRFPQEVYPNHLSGYLGVPEPFVGGLCALAEALGQNSRYFDHMATETARLRDKLEKGIQAGVPESVIFFNKVERLPNCCAIGFPGVFNEALLYFLHRNGVYATLGGGRLPFLSQVLMQSGVDERLSYSALSFSLSFETREEEVDFAIHTIVACANQLKTHSMCLMEDQ
jgi:cysteine desulfurase